MVLVNSTSATSLTLVEANILVMDEDGARFNHGDRDRRFDRFRGHQ